LPCLYNNYSDDFYQPATLALWLIIAFGTVYDISTRSCWTFVYFARAFNGCVTVPSIALLIYTRILVTVTIFCDILACWKRTCTIFIQDSVSIIFGRWLYLSRYHHNYTHSLTHIVYQNYAIRWLDSYSLHRQQMSLLGT